MGTSGFTFFESYFDALQYLQDKDFGAIMRVICAYALKGEEPQISDPILKSYWTLIRPTLDRSIKRSEAGRLGGKSGAGVSRNISNANAVIKSKSIANQKQINSKSIANQNEINTDKDKEKEKDKEKDMCVNARARVTPTPAASSEDTHTDFLFEIEKAFFLRGFISPQLIAKDMIDYYTGEGKDLQLLPLRQAVAKVTNWNPKKESDYTRTDTGIAALFVSLVERMDISTSSKLKMIEAYKCIAWSGDHLIFKFTDNFIASAFRTYCKDYDELLSKHFNGIMKFIDAE